MIKQEKEFKIGGKKRLVKFGTNASAIYCDEHNISLSKYNESFALDMVTIGQLRDVIWSGLVAGCYKQKKEVDFTKYDVGDWIDDLQQEEIDNILSLLMGESDKKKAGKA